MPERKIIRFINTDKPVNTDVCARGNEVSIISRTGAMQGVERVECQNCVGCEFQNGMQDKNLTNITLTCGEPNI